MKCPYCNSDNWDYNTNRKSVIEPIDESFIEYFVVHRADCGKDFVSKEVYEIIEMGTAMTMEEIEKGE